MSKFIVWFNRWVTSFCQLVEIISTTFIPTVATLNFYSRSYEDIKCVHDRLVESWAGQSWNFMHFMYWNWFFWWGSRYTVYLCFVCRNITFFVHLMDVIRTFTAWSVFGWIWLQWKTYNTWVIFSIFMWLFDYISHCKLRSWLERVNWILWWRHNHFGGN